MPRRQDDGQAHLLLIGGGVAQQERIRSRFDGHVSVFCSADLVTRLPVPERNYIVIGFGGQADLNDWVRAARQLDHCRPISHVAGLSGRNVVEFAAVAAALGLAGPDVGAARIAEDKLQMRRHLIRENIDTVAAFEIDDFESASHIAAQVGFPLIVKPNTGVASRGVSRVDTFEDLADAIDWGLNGIRTGAGADYQLPEKLIIEPLLTGKEYSVDSFSEGGTHRTVCIAEKVVDEHHFVELGHSIPALLRDDARRRIERFVESVLTALGVRDGLTHTEVIDTGERVSLIETHLRPGGDRIHDAFTLATGVDLIDLRIDQMLGEEVLDKLDEQLQAATVDHKHSLIRFGPIPSSGTLASIDGLEQARTLPFVAKAEQIAPTGTDFDRSYGSAARPYLLLVCADTIQNAQLAAQEAESLISVRLTMRPH